MTNFTQVCRIKRNFDTQLPELIIRINPEKKEKRLVGTLIWIDGTDHEGNKRYQYFNFSTVDQELIQFIQNEVQKNPDVDLDVRGFLKRDYFEKDEKTGKYIKIKNAEIFVKNVFVWEKRDKTTSAPLSYKD